MVVIGNSGETFLLEEIFMGSHTKDIVREVNLPTLVVKNEQKSEYKKILIPTNLSESSKKTIEKTAEFFPNSKLILFNRLLSKLKNLGKISV